MTDELDAPQRLFDLPHTMARQAAQAILDDLVSRWERQHGRALRDLQTDLQAMHDLLFNPVAREERLRRELERLRPRLDTAPPPEAPPALVRDVGGAWLVTPEGRVAVACLKRSLAGTRDERIQIDAYDIHAAEHVLASTYGTWVRYRLDRVLALRHGEARAMLPVSIATVLLLLVNGNVGSDQALVQPKESRDRALLDDAVTKPIEAFTMSIEGGGNADRRHWSLYNGYPLSEARRRLGDDLILERVPTQKVKRLFVAADAEQRVLEMLARELRARDVDAPRADSAFQDFIDAYQRVRPQLSAYSTVHARTSHSRRLRQMLLDAL
jgi:hypothetical protein